MARIGSITVLGCRKCGKCDSICNAGALDRTDSNVRIDHEKCTLCMRCVMICPNRAIKYLD